MAKLGRLFDANTIGDSLANSFKPSGRNIFSGGMLGGLVDNPKGVGADLKNRPPAAAVPMPDAQAISLQQRRLLAQMAAAGGGRASTILSPQSDSTDKLGP